MDLSDPPALPLILFSLSLLVYHALEVLLVLFHTPSEFDRSSFLLSPTYVLAMTLSLLEYLLTWRFFPAFKTTLRLPGLLLGAVLAFSGDLLRKLAWLTARHSFTHRIQTRRRPAHVLVRKGVYAWARHPAYLGWFVWAVGTQVLLANLVSSVAFALAAWRFFRHRIPVEEHYLVRMFGREYELYRQNTPTRIPGIP